LKSLKILKMIPSIYTVSIARSIQYSNLQILLSCILAIR
jgi:hypothetical protein